MSDVSCRSWGFFTAAAAEGVLSLDALLQGLPVSHSALEDPAQFITWDQWAALMSRLGTLLGSRQALIDAGRFALRPVYESNWWKPASHATSLFSSTNQLYLSVWQRVFPKLFPRGVYFSIREQPDKKLVMHAELRPGFRDCEEWFWVLQGALQHLPVLARIQQQAEVASTISPARGDYTVIAPRSRGLFEIVGQVWKQWVTPSSVVPAVSQVIPRVSAVPTPAPTPPPNQTAPEDDIESALARHPGLVLLFRGDEIVHANAFAGEVLTIPPAALVGSKLASVLPSALLREGGFPRQLALGPSQRCFEWLSAGPFLFRGEPTHGFFGTAQPTDSPTEVSTHPDAPAALPRLQAAPTPTPVSVPTPPPLLAEGEAKLPPSWVEHYVRLGQASAQGSHEIRNALATIFAAVAIIKESTANNDLTQQGLFAELEVVNGAGRKIQEIILGFIASPRGASGSFAAAPPAPLPEPQAPTAPAVSIIPAEELAMAKRDAPPAPHRYPVSIEKAAQNAKRSAALHLGRAQVLLALSGVPRVLADERKLEQVLVNLIQNAAQAMPVDRAPTENHIRVSARQSEGWVWVEVADNGVGISEEEQRILFTPFYTTKAEGVGTGLGLVNCRDLLREFGGDISLKSKPGQGTTATLVLEAVPALYGGPSLLNRPRLVVLASERVASLWSEYLYNRHEIITAETPEAALAHLRERPAALVLCDVSPALGDVVEFYQKALSFSPSLKGRFLFVVGTPSERVRRFLEDVNETRLAKPLSAEQARRAVLAALGESELTP